MSLIYFVTFALTLSMGLFILYIQPREKLNRLFFLVCFSVSIWSFSLSIAASSYTTDNEFFWIRHSSIGWGSVYAFLLHFSILLTDQKYFTKRPFRLALLYLPPLLTVYLFFLSDRAPLCYSLVRTSSGFLSFTLLKNPNCFWPVLFFYLYYPTYVATAITIIYRYGKEHRNDSECSQCRFLMFSFFLTFVIGSFFELSYLWKPDSLLSHLSVLTTLIPLTAIFYILRKYRFLLPNRLSIDYPEQILDEYGKSYLAQYIASFFIMLSFVSFASQYFGARFNLGPQIFFSGMTLLFAISLGFVHRMRWPQNIKDLIFVCLICLAIPFITQHFSKYNSVTIAAFPFGLLLLSVLFDKRWMILMVGLSTLLTHVFMTFSTRDRNIFVDATDYWLRISFFAALLFIALHIRRLYARRLLDNEQEMNFQKEISSVSAKFLTATAEDIEDKISYLLSIAGNYFRGDRVYIFLFSEDRKSMNYCYEWCAPDVKPALGLTESIDPSDYPWLMSRILGGEFVYIQDTSRLEAQASAEKELFTKRNIRSLMNISILNEKGPIGFLGINSKKITENWNSSHQNMLRLLSNLLSDTFERIDFEKSIHLMAFYDPLTELPNRFYLNQRLEKSISESKNPPSLTAILFLDIDSFVHINETIGHSAGNLFLREVGRRLRQSIRDERDFLTRFGGDEFILVLSSLETAQAVESLTQRIIDSFREPILIENKEFFITLSIGISLYPADGEDAHTLIKNADAAMYESKRTGKNQYTFCSPQMKKLVLEKIRLTNHLHRALERRELVLFYQPQVNAQTGEIVGFESLLRWKHPQMGMVSPGAFIPLAEQSGLIHSIGKWVLFTACRQAQAWEEKFGLHCTMAVNLAARQFNDPGLVDLVKRALDETLLPPELLEIEITESEDMQKESHILTALHELKKLRLRIAIDDFGTKYSSLNRLKKLPIDKMKIDMQFIHGITHSAKDQGIAKSIIDLSKNLGLRVIGEGVETEEHLAFLRANGCDEIQGYYFYRPMPAEEITEILRNTKRGASPPVS